MCNNGIGSGCGRITTKAYINIQEILRNMIKEIGYTDSTLESDGNTCAVVIILNNQSSDVAMGLIKHLRQKKKEYLKSK